MPVTAVRAAPAYPAPIPQRPPAVAVPKVRTRSGVQTGVSLLLLLIALCAVAFGILYLSGHARVTAEGYRRVKLLAQLKQEQARAQSLREQSAAAMTPDVVEAGAKTIGLTRPGDKEMMTAGEK